MCPTRRVRLPLPRLSLPPWPSGDGTSLTKRQSSQVRVLPGVLRSGLEPGSQHGLISRPTPVQIRPPQLTWSGSVAAARRPGKRGRPGSIPGQTSGNGLLVEQEDAALAMRKSGCDSPAVHCFTGRNERGSPVPERANDLRHPAVPHARGVSLLHRAKRTARLRRRSHQHLVRTAPAQGRPRQPAPSCWTTPSWPPLGGTGRRPSSSRNGSAGRRWG